ncbi:hypothetical protein B0T18DRAFT_412809 [Schizothecium vesticola]|uniref:Uncharacterized protein n=1 Tax=Schizothecium vesticola TaxID=314040 RepID=A0AA40EWN7_9PEZI|nr:hypothetical protein B0T18DRAFT_412809 [Schizothecium vesticola]
MSVDVDVDVFVACGGKWVRCIFGYIFCLSSSLPREASSPGCAPELDLLCFVSLMDCMVW